MNKKVNRFLLLIVACSATGVVLGGTASWADSTQCLKTDNPTSQCLTQDPLVKTIQGMSTGLIAGAGAAFGVTWQIQQKD